jgi:hypothetical protein
MNGLSHCPHTAGDLVAGQPITEVVMLLPNSGVAGRFLEEVQNMFNAKAVRIGGLLARIMSPAKERN